MTQNLLLPITVTMIPGLISSKYFFYLTYSFWQTDHRGKNIRFDAVVSAFSGAITCLITFGIFLVVERLYEDFNPTRVEAIRDYFRLIDRTIIVGFAAWTIIGFHFIIGNVVRSPLIRSALQVYILTYIALKYLSSQNYSPIRLLSYGYNRLPEIFVSGTSFAEVSSTATFWPETLLDFFFYFTIIFCVLRYVVNVLIYIQAQNSSAHDGPFDLEAIIIAVNAFIWIVAVMLSFGMLHIELGGLGLTTGLIAAGLTISFRDLLNNFFSGILLNLDKSIKMRDLIRMSDGVIGEVKKISLRYTFLETRDNVDILVPNSVLIQNRFENLTRTQQEVRLTLRFSVGQDADVDIVEKLASKACMYVPEVSAVTARLPAVFYLGVSESSHLFDLKFWVIDPRPGPAKLQSDVAKQIFRVFKRERISRPIIRQMTVEDSGLPKAEVSFQTSRPRRSRRAVAGK
jgi:small-conductance mechanosensitive channel